MCIYRYRLHLRPKSPDFNLYRDRDGPIVLSAINVFYETLCLVLTVAKTLGLYRAQRRTGISTALSSLLLRDGEHQTSFPRLASLNRYLRI